MTLTDRERILLHIIQGLSFTMTLYHGPTWGPDAYRQSDGDHYVHFDKWSKPKAGDLVMGSTGGIQEWKLAWFVEDRHGQGAVVREIGSGRRCNYDNETFYIVRGLHASQLYEGEQFKFYGKVLQAFSRGGEYSYRFGGLDFDDDDACVWVREAHGGFGNESIPFEVRMPWGKRTSVKAVLQALRDGGYGTKSFRPDPFRKLIAAWPFPSKETT